jgi:hypothetical protein
MVRMPTASIAVSTPRPPVSRMIASAALPSLLLTVAVAPKRFDTVRRLSSTSTITMSDGEKNCAARRAASPTGPHPHCNGFSRLYLCR